MNSLLSLLLQSQISTPNQKHESNLIHNTIIILSSTTPSSFYHPQYHPPNTIFVQHNPIIISSPSSHFLYSLAKTTAQAIPENPRIGAHAVHG